MAPPDSGFDVPDFADVAKVSVAPPDSGFDVPDFADVAKVSVAKAA